MIPLAIGYFGDGPWAHRALEKLLDDHSLRIAFVCARYYQPDAALKDRARNYGIPFLTHENINSDEFLESVSPFGCNLFVSMSFDQIIRKRLMQYPQLGTINCHAGKLPFYRGRNVLNWALINDEKTFGITVHYVDEGIDTGDIIAQREYQITDSDTYATLLERAYAGCADLLYDAIKRLQGGQAQRTRQATLHPLGFYCTARQEGDERLNWKQSSREIFNFVRAISRPGPEARTNLGEKEIRVNRVEYLSDAPVFKGIPGAVLGFSTNGFFVKTADSYVKVIEWSGIDKPRIGDRLK